MRTAPLLDSAMPSPSPRPEYASARRSLPREPRQDGPARGRGRRCPCASHVRNDDVSRDGHALLAGAGGGGTASTMTCARIPERRAARRRFHQRTPLPARHAGVARWSASPRSSWKPCSRSSRRTGRLEVLSLALQDQTRRPAHKAPSPARGRVPRGQPPGAQHPAGLGASKGKGVGEVRKAKDDGRLPMEHHNTRIVVFGRDATQARALAEAIVRRPSTTSCTSPERSTRSGRR